MMNLWEYCYPPLCVSWLLLFSLVWIMPVMPCLSSEDDWDKLLEHWHCDFLVFQAVYHLLAVLVEIYFEPKGKVPASKQEVWAKAQGSQRVKLPKSAMFPAKGFKTRFPRKLSRSSGVATIHPNNLSLGMFLVIPQHHQHGPFSHPKTRRRGHEDHLSPSGAVNVVANGASRRKQRPSLPDVMQLSCDQVTKVKSYSIGALWWDGIWE